MIDVGKNSNNVIVPYISYYNGTARLPAIAKPVVQENGTMDFAAQGTSADIFTGNWEISLVPTSQKVTSNYYDKINVGLWKKNGVIVNSNATGFIQKTSADNSSSNVKYNGETNKNSRGYIYGNGTANPIMGYAIQTMTGTSAETAQMR